MATHDGLQRTATDFSMAPQAAHVPHMHHVVTQNNEGCPSLADLWEFLEVFC